MKHFFILLIVSFSILNSQAQKEAEKMYAEAEEYTATARFEEALQIYKQLLKTNKESFNYNFKIGFSYYMIPEKKDNAISFFEKASENISPQFSNKFDETSAPVETWLYIADIYHKNYMFDEAIVAYDTLKTYIKDKEKLEEINRNIESCKTGSELIFKTIDVSVVRLGSSINSKYDEHSPVLTADLKKLIFTSKRKGTGGMKDVDGNFFEDIYISEYKNNIWSQPKSISDKINTVKHEASVGLSIDGKTLYIYKDSRGGDLYYSKFKNNEWSKPKSLGKNINTKYKEAHASVSADGNTLYFSSNKKGGLGGMDIYVSKRQKNGTWGKPVNISSTINTKYDEEGPYIHPDDSTLYFSSKGHKGMGGFDLFTTTLKPDGTWTEPKNLGYPVNSTNDDIFYTSSPGGSYGFYVSNQMGFSGSRDITMVINPQKKRKKVGVVKGNVFVKNEKGKIKKDSLDVDINIIDPFLGDTIRTYKTDTADCDYTLVIPTEINYIISYSAPGQLTHLEYVRLSGKSDLLTGKNSHVMDTVVLNSKRKRYSLKFHKDSDSLDYLSKLYLDVINYAMTSNKNYDAEFSTPETDPLLNRRKNKVFKYLESNNLDTSLLRNKTNNNQNYEILLADSIFFTAREQERIIAFKNASAEIEFTSKHKLNELVTYLKHSDDLDIEIPFNVNDTTVLNRERLKYIFDYFTDRNIDSLRIFIKPVDDGFDYKRKNKIKLIVKNKEKINNLVLLHKFLGDDIFDFTKIIFSENVTEIDLTSKLKLNKLSYFYRKGKLKNIEIPSYESYSTSIVSQRINSIKNFITKQGVDNASIDTAHLYGKVNDVDVYNLRITKDNDTSKELIVAFKDKKAQVEDSSKPDLDELLGVLKKDTNLNINIPLNVNDPTGLSRDRLKYLYDYFSNNGIDDSRIYVEPKENGTGKSNKITINAIPKEEQNNEYVTASDYFGNNTDFFAAIIFDEDDEDLDLKSMFKLNKLAFMLKNELISNLEIPLYNYENIWLSEKRVNNIRKYFNSMKVDTVQTNIKTATGGVDDENIYNLNIKKEKIGEQERKIVFKDSEAEIENYSKRDLDDLLSLLKTYRNLNINIPLNIEDPTELSRERLKYLYDYFKDNGIDDSRLFIKPIESEDAVLNSLKVKLTPDDIQDKKAVKVSDYFGSNTDYFATIIFDGQTEELDIISKFKLNKLSFMLKKGELKKADIPFYYGDNLKLSKTRVNNIKDFFKSQKVDSLNYVVVARTVDSDDENIYPLILHTGDIQTDEIANNDIKPEEINIDNINVREKILIFKDDSAILEENSFPDLDTLLLVLKNKEDLYVNISFNVEDSTELERDRLKYIYNYCRDNNIDDSRIFVKPIEEKDAEYNSMKVELKQKDEQEDLVTVSDFLNYQTGDYDTIIFSAAEPDLDLISKLKLNKLSYLIKKGALEKAEIPFYYGDNIKLSKSRVNNIKDFFESQNVDSLNYEVIARTVDSDDENVYPLISQDVKINYGDRDIVFQEKSAVPKKEAMVYLDELLAMLDGDESFIAEIPVNVDETINLSENRVQYIYDYFANNGVGDDRIFVYPVDSETSEIDKLNVKVYPESNKQKESVTYSEFFGDQTFKFSRIIFDESEVNLSLNNKFKLNKLSNYLNSRKDTLVEIPLYADDETKLSDQRVNSILNYFKAHGVDSFQNAVKLSEEDFGNKYDLNFFNADDYKSEESIAVSEDCEFLNSEAAFATVYFGFDKYRTYQTAALDSIVDCLKANPDYKVEVGGHTDAIGPSDYNFILGRRRAGFVRKYLINKGIEAHRLVKKSYSEDSPIAENTLKGNDNPAGRKLNRRVELRILNPV